MGHPPEYLEGAGATLAWVGPAGVWDGALSCPRQALQLTSGSSRVPWLQCQVSTTCLSVYKLVAAMQCCRKLIMFISSQMRVPSRFV